LNGKHLLLFFYIAVTEYIADDNLKTTDTTLVKWLDISTSVLELRVLRGGGGGATYNNTLI
jgi:hypothetical protein